ncbi:extracellular solute-binding protein [Phototrophicus methaneseepsis]|uniref:Extracellular solute-binding protein n=1 Tax=Phototrophicus methaneseepsis TaxID=2710758 RepID=A0A7S8IDF7_9CHLR|nr:extracellular solute-binding protein [Phototrophicus methaneseepsis]QPC81522.1 extracellular solute-binding protein [Phototrophicus methaneseepsis]
MRRNFVGILLVVALVLGVVTSAMAQDDANTLEIWADVTRAPVLNELAPTIEEELGITLEVVELGLGDIRDQLLIAGPVGEGPDIIIQPHDSLGLLVANGAIVPLDLEGYEDLFYESTLDLFTFDGQLWGIPYGIENVALIRNTDLIPEAPSTWQEVTDLAAEMEDGKYAFLMRTGDAYHAFPIFSAFGGYIFGRNEDGSFNTDDIGLNSEGAIAAGEWMEMMYANGYMIPNVGDDESFAMFEDGDLGMFITGPWFSERIVQTGIPYSIDPIPGAEGGLEQGASFSGGQGFLISAFSDKQLLAEAFLLDYVATDEFMQALYDLNPLPPAFKAVDTSSDPNVEGFIAAGSNAVPMPAIPEMGGVWTAAGDSTTLISTGSDATETLNNAVLQIQDAIQLVVSGDRTVVIAGSLQDEAGCDGEWDPACLSTQLMDEDGDGIYEATFSLPAGDYEYKVAMNGGWDENYGADGVADGSNLTLSLAEDTDVTFTYDDSTHVITDSVNNG